jgi:hypothetical protein
MATDFDRRRFAPFAPICLTALAAVVAVVGLFTTTGAAAHPRCFGAAARDPYRPCHSSALDRAVYPTPAEAQITPNSPCAPVRSAIFACAFGAPAAHATGEIALVGDSHAWHWRAGVDVVTRALGWRAYSSTRAGCPFTHGVLAKPKPVRRSCSNWNASLLRWFRDNPQISIVFTSNHPARVDAVRGQDRFSAEVAGITAAWAALPATVKHVIVIKIGRASCRERV